MFKATMTKLKDEWDGKMNILSSTWLHFFYIHTEILTSIVIIQLLHNSYNIVMNYLLFANIADVPIHRSLKADINITRKNVIFKKVGRYHILLLDVLIISSRLYQCSVLCSITKLLEGIHSGSSINYWSNNYWKLKRDKFSIWNWV